MTSTSLCSTWFWSLISGTSSFLTLRAILNLEALMARNSGGGERMVYALERWHFFLLFLSGGGVKSQYPMARFLGSTLGILLRFFGIV